MDTLLTQAEAAAILNVPVRTLEAWRLRGGGPRYLRLPRVVRYRHDDLEKWLEDRRRSCTSDPGGRDAAAR
jgi:phage terminase Nu1 subunit (DNA packaging protein)